MTVYSARHYEGHVVSNVVVWDGDKCYSQELISWFEKHGFGKRAEDYCDFDQQTKVDVEMSDKVDLGALKVAFWLQSIEPLKTAYSRDQHYGGAEEGGWYYHTLKAVCDASEEPEYRDSHGEGIVHRLELYRGAHEDLARPHYC